MLHKNGWHWLTEFWGPFVPQFLEPPDAASGFGTGPSFAAQEDSCNFLISCQVGSRSQLGHLSDFGPHRLSLCVSSWLDWHGFGRNHDLTQWYGVQPPVGKVLTMLSIPWMITHQTSQEGDAWSGTNTSSRTRTATVAESADAALAVSVYSLRNWFTKRPKRSWIVWLCRKPVENL